MAKREKDIAQAEALILALLEKRSEDLRLAWEEAYERGPQWRKMLLSGMEQLSPEARDLIIAEHKGCGRFRREQRTGRRRRAARGQPARATATIIASPSEYVRSMS